MFDDLNMVERAKTVTTITDSNGNVMTVTTSSSYWSSTTVKQTERVTKIVSFNKN